MRPGANVSEGHTTLVQTILEHPDTGPGSDMDVPPATSTTTTNAHSGEAAAPTMHSAFANLAQSHPNLQLPPSALGSDGVLAGTAPHPAEPSDRNLPPQPIARTVSKSGTPRSLHATDSGVPPIAEPDAPATATPKTPGRSAFVGSMGPAAAGGPTSTAPPASVSTSVASAAPKKKKASDMSKAERRALQEEQRAKKAAAKEVQGLPTADSFGAMRNNSLSIRVLDTGWNRVDELHVQSSVMDLIGWFNLSGMQTQVNLESQRFPRHGPELLRRRKIELRQGRRQNSLHEAVQESTLWTCSRIFRPT